MILKKVLRYGVLLPIAFIWDGVTFLAKAIVEICGIANDYLTEKFEELVEWSDQ